tara:strand:- start:18992 stop:19423 length:432 start_codon:yes stop_codon:yes gene_type:complete
MANYLFQNRDFGITELGIYLLRNGYNYKTLPFSDISSVEITRGNVLKNRMLLIIIGSGMLLFACYHFFRIYIFFNTAVGESFNVEEILIPFSLLTLGTYILYASFKQELILKVCAGQQFKFSIKDLDTVELTSYLKQKAKLVN